MVDIHSHILPGLDDGPATLEESVAMVRMAAESGTTDIVATPHANLEYSFEPELVDRKIAELTEASGAAPRIHRGCDFHLYYENIQRALSDPARYAINGKGYLLVEFSDLLIFPAAGEVFGRMRESGLTPVITHPERNALLARDLEQIRQWVDAGCRVQVTAQSLSGRFGRRVRAAAEEMLRCGLVHFVASDAHDARHRPPVLAEAYRHVAARYGDEHAQALFETNPRAALGGEEVKARLPEPKARPVRWWRWW
jgi:protein-tyrosine phosphatase